jgi:GNAT superfamily N-acetyltransferase
VGWLKLAPAATLDKLYQRRPYAKMPCFSGNRDAVYTVACVLVDAAWRRRGVAQAMIHEAVNAAFRWGADCVEALPRTGTDDPQLLQMGPEAAFLKAGFEVVQQSIRGYPVLQCWLRGDSRRPPEK